LSKQTHHRRLKFVGLFVLTLFVVYLVIYPSLQIYWHHNKPVSHIQELEEMSLSELMLLRSMEACTALWMFALGASIGSFMNVVVYRLPRGRSLLWQRSQCPHCQYYIAGKDNLPILGWLLLNGSCRNCGSPISARYPIVETATACLFLLFYFVELLSGGVNLPVRHPNSYAGVVWILFYTKWDLVRLYFYHCFLFSTLLAWALIHFDGHKIPLRSLLTAGLAAVVAACEWPDLQLLRESSTTLIPLTAEWQQAGLASASGAMSGVVLSLLLGLIHRLTKGIRAQEAFGLIGPLALTGAVLGVQGMLSATVLMLVLNLLRQGMTRVCRCGLDWPLSGDLLLAVVGQHLVWSWLVKKGEPWWPGPTTSLTQLAFVAAGILMLAALQGISQRDWSASTRNPVSNLK